MFYKPSLADHRNWYTVKYHFINLADIKKQYSSHGDRVKLGYETQYKRIVSIYDYHGHIFYSYDVFYFGEHFSCIRMRLESLYKRKPISFIIIYFFFQF